MYFVVVASETKPKRERERNEKSPASETNAGRKSENIILQMKGMALLGDDSAPFFFGLANNSNKPVLLLTPITRGMH